MTEYISREMAIKKLQMQLLDLEADQDKGEYSELCENRGARDALDEAINDIRAIKGEDVQPVDRWISVKDRLPEIGKSVLVIVSINAKANLPLCTDLALEMRIGWLDDNGKWGLQFDSADRDEILYWMPLPEPPQD